MMPVAMAETEIEMVTAMATLTGGGGGGRGVDGGNHDIDATCCRVDGDQ